jgi:hypothetical protein
LSNEQAQEVLNQRHEAAAGVTQRQTEMFAAKRTEWETSTWADPELGGSNKDATLANVKLVMDKFAPEGSAFRKELAVTGYGNHPEFVRFVNSIGKAMREDKPINGGAGASGQRTACGRPLRQRFLVTTVFRFSQRSSEMKSFFKQNWLMPITAIVFGLFLAYTGNAHAGFAVVGFGGATLSTSALTLSDWAKRLDPDGKVPTIVEMLSQTNEILDDMLFIEGNLPTGHRTNVRTGLPAVAWRLLNQATTPGKSTTAQIDEQAAMLEAWSEVDEELAKLNGNTAAFRLSEAQAFIEAMNQEMAQTLFYGNSGLAPEEFTGLSTRFSAISGATNAQNVVDGGGTGSDNTSIWLVVWGENQCCGIFPKGSKAGLQHEDYGVQTVTGTAGIGGSRLRAYQERWQWKAGIALKDWRYVVRIPNIDVSNLVGKSSAADLQELMIKATYRPPSLSMGRAAWYMNRTVAEMLDIQRRDDVGTGGGLTFENVDGKRTGSFRNIPIRVVDQLLLTEARVV